MTVHVLMVYDQTIDGKEQARSQDRFFWGVRDPKKVDLWTQKVDFFEPHPLTLLQKPHFWSTLWLKVDLLADLGVRRTPAPPWLRAW